MKKLKTKLFYFLLFISGIFYGQITTEANNGTYHLLEEERGMGNKKTKTKIFQYGALGETKVLAVAACGRCSPALYKYLEEESKTLGRSIFYNKIGLYFIAYDVNSFVIIMPTNKKDKNWSDFTFSNFYSKDKSKVEGMTKQKIKDFIIKISK